MMEDWGKYLGSRKIWLAALLYFVIGNALSYVVNMVFEVSLIFSSVLSFVLLGSLMYYLKSAELDVSVDNSIAIFAVFAALQLVLSVLTILGFLFFVPSGVFLGLDNFALVFSVPLSALGFYFLFEEYRSDRVPLIGVSVFVGLWISSLIYYSVSKVTSFAVFSSKILIGPEALTAVFNGFLMLSGVVFWCRDREDYGARKMAVFALLGYGLFSFVLDYASSYMMYEINSMFPKSVFSLSLEPILVASTGISYYILIGLEDVRKQFTAS